MDEALGRQGIEALRRGDGKAALDFLTRCSLADGEAQKPWLALAQAHRLLGDAATEANTLQILLRHDPRNLSGLLLMAQVKERTGDDRAASSFYQAALNQAGVADSIPQALHPMLDHGQNFLAKVQGQFADHLSDSLAKAGFGASQQPGRVGEALDLLLGRSELFVQQPTSFYFPGLPQRQFYERDEFAWLPAVEAAIPVMQDELTSLMARSQGFSPYVESNAERPLPNNPLRDDASWSALYFWRNGALQADNAAAAPATIAALAQAPIPVIAKRSPMALYSRLEPGTHIQPHNGLLNTRLICHVPLITQDDCGLRVGNETRSWEPGKTLIFDDSIEHEAWNRGPATRIVLLFEIWRPEISLDERAALTAIFEAINAYSGAPVDQG